MTCSQLVEWAESEPPAKEHWKKATMRKAVLKVAGLLRPLHCKAGKNWRAKAKAAQTVLNLPRVPKLQIGVMPKSPVTYSHHLKVKGQSLGLKVVSIEGGGFCL